MVAPRTPVVALAVAVALLASASGAVASTAAVPATSTDAVSAASTDVVSATSTTATPDPNNTTLVKDGEELVLQPAPNQTVRGETTLDPGTEVVVTLEGPTFYRGTTTTVTDEGTFNVTADLSGASPGTTIGVSVRTNPPEGKETLLVATTASIDCAGNCPSGTAGSDGGEMTVDANETDLQSITEVTQGRIASIDVSFGDADALTVSIGGPSVNYVVNGTVHDEDGDGRATVLFDTGDAGTDAPTLSVVDAGERRVVEASAETSLDSPLAPATYEVTLSHGSNSTDEPVAVGQVLVFEETQSSASGDASIVTEGEELVLQPEANQTIRGETDLEPGTNLSVTIEGERFLMTSVATVAEDGTFESTVDLTDLGGERLQVSVRHDDATLAEAEGRIACADDCEATTGDESGADATTGATEAPSADADAPSTDDSENRLLGGVGMLALGGVLAVAGIGVVLGLFRD